MINIQTEIDKIEWIYKDNILFLSIDKIYFADRIETFFIGDIENELETYISEKIIDDGIRILYNFDKKYKIIKVMHKKILNDFLHIQKNKIFTLHHSALQELYKIDISSNIVHETIKNKINNLKNKLNL